jgi:predicted phosphoribosyltransferase
VIFQDRSEGGRLLAQALRQYEGRPDVVVLALPRGGVPVAYEVAKALKAPLDVFIVRKLGVPGHEELAMGAIATGGVRILNDEVVRQLNVPPQMIELTTMREQQELERRERLYRGDKPAPDVRGKTVIVVDDGLATGSTMKVALAALRQQQPAKLIAAAPIAPPDTCESLQEVADEVVCAVTPEPFMAVGAWYRRFDQTTDEEVRDLMKRAA